MCQLLEKFKFLSAFVAFADEGQKGPVGRAGYDIDHGGNQVRATNSRQ
jgi:hypothetical protein